MASSSGTSSTSSSMEEGNCGVDGTEEEEENDFESGIGEEIEDEKQKHLDELMAMVAQLRKDNQQIVANLWCYNAALRRRGG
ncbi:hypothetical protein SDJN02_27714, partial [Cucurbita argyrosperma subsp. argyrosperma]